MTKATTANKKIIELFESENVISDSTLHDIETFLKTISQVSKVLKKFQNIKKKEICFSLKDVANLLNIEKEDIEIFKDERFGVSLDILAETFDRLLNNESDHISKLIPNISYTGKNFSNSKAFEGLYSIKIKKNTKFNKLESLMIKQNELNYLIIKPASIYIHDRNYEKTKASFWLVCSKNTIREAFNHWNSLLEKYNIIRNNVIDINTSGGLELVDFKSPFSLNEISIPSNLKQECEYIINMFSNFKNFKTNDIPIMRGLLVYGSLGVGKTTTINAIINETLKHGTTVFRLIASETNMYSPTEPFDFIYKQCSIFEPSLIILEDFDLLAGNRTESRTPLNNKILQLLENKPKNCVILMTTNKDKKALDEAAIRTGRVDKEFSITYPDVEMKLKIFETHCKKHNFNIAISNNILKFLEKNINGSTISSIILTAVQKACIENRTVKEEDIEFAISGFNINQLEQYII